MSREKTTQTSGSWQDFFPFMFFNFVFFRWIVSIFVSDCVIVKTSKIISIICETHKTVNIRNIYGMLLCCQELANKARGK